MRTAPKARLRIVLSILVAVMLFGLWLLFSRQSMLHRAVQSGDTFRAQIFIKLGADVNNLAPLAEFDKLQRGRTPLYIAVERNDASMVKFLLRNGAEPFRRTPYSHFKDTPLEAAAQNSNTEFLRLLLDHGVDNPHVGDINVGAKALVIAVQNECVECVSILLESEAVSWDELFFSTIVFNYAVSSRNREILKLLLPHLADVYRKKCENLNNIPLPAMTSEEHDELADLIADHEFETVLQMLRSENNAGALSMLLISEPEFLMSLPLHAAAIMGDVALIRFLADAGAPVNLADRDGKTPLMCALRYCRVEAARVLIEELHSDIATDGPIRPIFIIPRDPEMRVPAVQCFDETIALLMRAGVDINERDSADDTLLHHLARENLDKHIVIAVARGALVDAINASGETPLHIAARRNSTEAAFALLERGASKTIRNAENKTPYDLMWATYKSPELLVAIRPDEELPQ